MVEKMKAALLYGVRDVRIEEVPVKEIEPDQALIKIKACGICPTDVRSFTGQRKVSDFPRTLGHEWVGEIVEVGSEFKGFKVGDRVAPEWRAICGQCYYCHRGIFNYCQNLQRNKVSGGFYGYGHAAARYMRLIPDGMSYEEAAFAEPLACCLNGSEESGIRVGDDVVVIGAGPIGLQHVQLAKYQGARVIVSEFIESRRQKAKELGADDVIDPTSENPVERVKELTEGRGANAVIVAIGNSEASKTGIEMAGICGSVNFFAGTYPSADIPLDPNVVHYKQLHLTGSHDFTPHHFTTALKLIQFGIVDVKSIISHVMPLEEIADAFDIVANREGLKVIIRMD
ncbi:alcohol dehydrogenase catalytic domain-containing protein [Candidatus Poribacteria bacterium]|nr:alcohol dehydrogenase catalytic domain-containing protein [Candidatus Poribacteria bacterium]